MGSDNQKQKYGFRILEMVFGGFMVLAIMFLAKDFESTLFPVVKDFNVNEVKEVEDGIQITGDMNKVRDCTFRDMKVYMRVDGEKIPVAADFMFNDPAENLKTRASIKQAWGPWLIFIETEYDDADIALYARHSCHSFYDTSTKISEFSVQRNEDDNDLVLTQNDKNR